MERGLLKRASGVEFLILDFRLLSLAVRLALFAITGSLTYK